MLGWYNNKTNNTMHQVIGLNILVLKSHAPRKKNFTYISPVSMGECIGLIGLDEVFFLCCVVVWVDRNTAKKEHFIKSYDRT